MPFLRSNSARRAIAAEIPRSADPAMLAQLATPRCTRWQSVPAPGCRAESFRGWSQTAIDVICGRGANDGRHRRTPLTHVNAHYMAWGKRYRGGYHHGNLKEALVRAALELIGRERSAGFTFADAARWQA